MKPPKVRHESFYPPEFGFVRKFEGAFEQFLVDDLSVGTGKELTKFDLEVCLCCVCLIFPC